MHRILMEGGRAILQVPYFGTTKRTREDPRVKDREDREARFGQGDHVRIYSLPDISARMQEAGFTVCLHAPEELGCRFLCDRFGLDPAESLIVGERPVL